MEICAYILHGFLKVAHGQNPSSTTVRRRWRSLLRQFSLYGRQRPVSKQFMNGPWDGGITSSTRKRMMVMLDGAQGIMLTKDLVGLTLSLHVPPDIGHCALILQEFVGKSETTVMTELLD